MQRDLCAYLQDVLDGAAAIMRFTENTNLEEFSTNDVINSAVRYKFEIIGEALKQASRLFPVEIASVPDAKGVIQQRDRIAHGYFSIDPKVLLDSIRQDLPRLVDQVLRLKQTYCK
jgi:uncharacterized protein with HEPN domain